jgi:hypothetical protein
MFTEDPTVFLQDFGKPVAAGGVEGLGILNTPDEYVADGRVITTEYQLQAEASKFGNLSYNDSITVNGIAYTVREQPLLIDDGVFCLVLLTRAVVALSRLLLEDDSFLLLENGDRLLLEA